MSNPKKWTPMGPGRKEGVTKFGDTCRERDAVALSKSEQGGSNYSPQARPWGVGGV